MPVVSKSPIMLGPLAMETTHLIGPEVVQKVAVLARLEISPETAQAFSQQLSIVLEHIQKLAKVDVEGIEPMSHPVVTEGFRKDEARQYQISPESVVATAPWLAGAGDRVPPIR